MIDDFAKDVQTKNAAGAKLTLPLVVYDLPDRDCAAAASNGELSIADDGVNIYKTEYIDEIVKKVKAYPDVFFTLVIGMFSLQYSMYINHAHIHFQSPTRSPTW